MIFKPAKSTGLALGLAALVLLAGAEAGMLAFLRTAPTALAAFLAICLGLACLPAMGFIGYRCYGLAQARYVLSRNALVVDWGWRRELIPLQSIEAVQVVTEPGALSALRPHGLNWPGCLVGQADLPAVGPVEFLAATHKQGLVLVRYAGRTLALSPAEPQAFAEAFSQLQAEGPSAQIEPESEAPAFLHWAIWRDRPAFALPALGGLTGLVLIGYLLFTASARTGRSGAPLNALLLPAMAGLTWALNTALGMWLRRRPSEQPMAYLVWGATFFTQALIWGAVLSPAAGR